MVILDTSIVIERVRRKEEISEGITIVTVVEFPRVLEYKGFRGTIYFPEPEDFWLAYDIQRKLCKVGKAKSFADLLIAAICIREDDVLITKDRDFADIAEVSQLKVKVEE